MNNRLKYITFSFIIITSIILLVVIIFSSNFTKGNSKSDIINMCINNKSRFVSIQQFAAEMEDNLYVSIVNNVIKYDPKQEEMLRSNNLVEHIEYILKELKFKGIYGDSGNVKFIKTVDDQEIGIYYIESGISPENIPSSSYYEKISDNWFYYYENPT